MKRLRLFQLAGVLFLMVFFPELVFSETILLKSKQTITEQILDRTREYITVDFHGMVLKLYMADIESIDGEKVITPLEKEISASLQGDVELVRKLEEANKENMQLIQNVGKLQEELAGLYMNFKKDSSIVEDKDKIISDLKDEIEVMSQKDKDLIVELQSASKEISRLNKELNSFKNSSVPSKDADIEGLKESLDTDRDILSIEEKTRKMIEDYTDLFQQKDKVISELKEEIRNIKQKDGTSSKQLDDAKKEILKLKGDMESLQNTAAVNEEVVKKSKEEAEKNKKLISNLQSEIESFTKKSQELIGESGKGTSGK